MSGRVPAFAATHELRRQRERAWLRRTAGERGRRHLVRLLDWAITVAEEVNLGARAADDPALGLAHVLVEQLQSVAGLERQPSMDATTALERLYELQELYLLTTDEPDGDDGERAPADGADFGPLTDSELARAIQLARAGGRAAAISQMELVAGAAGVELAELRGASRSRELVALRRQLAVLLHGSGWSLPAIGRLLNRDHSSVLNLLRGDPASGVA